REFDTLLERREALAQGGQLIFGKRTQFCIIAGLDNLGQRLQLASGAAKRLDPVDDRAELAELLRQLGHLGRAQPGPDQGVPQLCVPPEKLMQALFKNGFHPQPNNASSRARNAPSAGSTATSLCSPVSRSRRVTTLRAVSSSPIKTAARALIWC